MTMLMKRLGPSRSGAATSATSGSACRSCAATTTLGAASAWRASSSPTRRCSTPYAARQRQRHANDRSQPPSSCCRYSLLIDTPPALALPLSRRSAMMQAREPRPRRPRPPPAREPPPPRRPRAPRRQPPPHRPHLELALSPLSHERLRRPRHRRHHRPRLPPLPLPLRRRGSRPRCCPRLPRCSRLPAPLLPPPPVVAVPLR